MPPTQAASTPASFGLDPMLSAAPLVLEDAAAVTELLAIVEEVEGADADEAGVSEDAGVEDGVGDVELATVSTAVTPGGGPDGSARKTLYSVAVDKQAYSRVRSPSFVSG